MRWFRETPEEKAARQAKYGARAAASKAKLQRRFLGSDETRDLPAYARDWRADELFASADVHVLPDCIVKISEEHGGIYSLAGVSARV